MPGTRANQNLPQDVHTVTRFFPVSEALRPYCSIIYHIEVNAPAGVRIDDYLHPEWANLRFIAGSVLLASVGSDAPSATAPFIATGPTSRATFFVRRDAAWGIGILPTGWAKFFDIPPI